MTSTDAPPPKPRTAAVRLTLNDGSTWTKQGVRDFCTAIEENYAYVMAEPMAEAAGAPLREALEPIVKRLERNDLVRKPLTTDYPSRAMLRADVKALRAALTATPAPASLDEWGVMMKGAEIGYTYGALGRDFAGVLPEIRRLTARAAATAHPSGSEEDT